MTSRLLVLGLDAADAGLVREWMAAGELPALSALAASGATARLESIADRFPDAVWTSLVTGCLPGRHGHYNWRAVRPGTYDMQLAPLRSRRKPFWRLLPGDVITFDVQGSFVDAAASGTQVVGWGQRAARVHESSPPELFEELETRHGRPPQWLDDDIVSRSARGEARYLRVLERSVAARTAVLLELLAGRPWDVCVASFHELHNGGHVFHRYVDPAHWAYDAARAKRFGRTLLGVYRLVDGSLGRVVDALPADTDVLVYSGAGFRANTNGLQVLPELMTRLGYTVRRTATPLPRALNAVSSAVPWSVRRHVNRRLSPQRQAMLLGRMWREPIDWRRTRAVAESAFSAGWIRVNLRGREPEGVVEPGDYDALCEEIAAELGRVTNTDTGEPAIEEVVRMDELSPGLHADELPDLYVRFRDDAFVRAAAHPRAGVVRENLRDVAASEHSGDGFVVASGPRIRQGGGDARGHIVDLAATALYLGGGTVPDDMDGGVLADLIVPEVLERRPVARGPVGWADDPWA